MQGIAIRRLGDAGRKNLLLPVRHEGVQQPHHILHPYFGCGSVLFQLKTVILLRADSLLPGKKQLVGEKRLQIIEVELDRRLPLQVGIIIGYVAFVHAVNHLHAVHTDLGTENFDT